MSYQSQRERVKDFFLKNIYPQMTEYGIDYNKTIFEIMNKTGASKTQVEDMLNVLVQNKVISECRTFELMQEEIIERRKKKDEEIEKELKKAGLVNGE